MQVSNVSDQDGLMAASLMQTMAVAEKLFDALKLAGLPVTGPGLEHRAAAAAWLGQVAREMAAQLKVSRAAAAAPAPAPAATGFKVKAMGPIPGAKPSRKRRK